MSRIEFGSERFFKRIITFIVMLVVAGLLTGLLFIWSKYADACERLAELEKSALSIEVSQQEAGQNTGLLAADSRNVSHTGEDLVYQTLYPELYVEKPDEFVPVYDAERFFYFTFHGGPSVATEKILDELLALDIKATFFVSAKEGTKNAEILNRIVEEGHSIGIYSGGESANRVYQSVETYLADFYKAFTYVEEQTGVRPSVFRFCSGTVNKYNVPVREQLTAEMLRRGFVYYDWNASGGDQTADAKAKDIAGTAIETAQEKQRIFLLLHDAVFNSETAAALKEITAYYQERGYLFHPITSNVRPVTFD